MLTDTSYGEDWVTWERPVGRMLRDLLYGSYPIPDQFEAVFQRECLIGPIGVCNAIVDELNEAVFWVIIPAFVAKALYEVVAKGRVWRLRRIFLLFVAWGWLLGLVQANLQLVTFEPSRGRHGICQVVLGMSLFEWCVLVVPHTAFYAAILMARYVPLRASQSTAHEGREPTSWG